MTEQRLSREFLDLGSNARSVMEQVVVGMLKRVGLSFESKRLETYSAVFTLTSDMTAKDLEYAIPRLAASGIVAARVEGDSLRVRANLDVTVALAKSRMPGHVALIEQIERVTVIMVPDKEETPAPPLIDLVKVLPLPLKEVVRAPDSPPIMLPAKTEKPLPPEDLEELKARVRSAKIAMGKPFVSYDMPIEVGLREDEGCVIKMYVVGDNDLVAAFHEALRDQSVTFNAFISGSKDAVGKMLRFLDPVG